jgi:hypothetical protein
VSRRRRRERSDNLDAALDGRLVEVDDELAPLVDTAAELRAVLAGIQLDPEAAERHLGMVLDGQAEVVALAARPRPQASRWRRRVAAVVLAAAVTVLPVTMASASALPGQALYPVKLAVEQLRVTAVSWSSTRKAEERIKITANRLDELNQLIQLDAADRIPAAIDRFQQASVDAQQAVAEAGHDSGDVRRAQASYGRLVAVRARSVIAWQRLQDKLHQREFPAGAQQAISAAIQQPPVTPDLLKGPPQPTPTTDGPVATTLAGSPTTTTLVPTTTLAPTTTLVPTTTLAATSTTVPAEGNDSPDQGGDGDSRQGGSGETATSLP